jgi:two-component system, NtrC family, sensor kinase
VHGNLPYLHEYFEDLKKIISTIEEESEADRALVKSLKEKLRYDFVITDLENILADLNEGTERIRHIIRNLKSFSRLDEAELKEASINEGLESTLKILSQYYGRDKIDARLNLANLPPVLCYPGQLNQVWMNLLSNAAEAVSGATDPHVSIQTSLDNDKVLISIEDNGSGIKKDAENKIFEPFFTTKPVGQGTGLGLSICHSIIARHGGKIWFESVNGRGTIFKVLIPIQASKPLATP